MIKVITTITSSITLQLRLRATLTAQLVIGVFFSQLAAADTLHYSIAKQPLAQALTQYAEQSNLQILYRPESLPNIDVEPLQGQFTPTHALDLLLRNTHLQYTVSARGAVVIQAAEVTLPIEPPAPTETAGKKPEAPVPEEMLVTGINTSLRRNLLTKREAGSVLDAMNAEDVGKFPDKNIADSLQRIPGVSVDRIWGEGRDIYIRGTDKDINRTLMNGQNVSSAYWWANDNPSRGFNYTILASELISSLSVYKSPQADIDEGSIGGTVIIYTHKPFDMEDRSLRFTLEGQYGELPNTTDPQLSLLANWQNSSRTFGALVALNWQNSTMRRDGLEAFPDNSLYSFSDDQGEITEDVYVIWGGGSAIFQQARERNTGNITLQWQPNDNWQAVFNYVGSAMDMDISNQNYLFMPGGFKLRESPPVVVSDPRFGTTGDGRKILLGGTMNNADSIGAALDAIFRRAYVDSHVYDLDMEYRADDLLIHAQLGTTNANGGTTQDQLYRFVGNTRERFSLSSNSIEVEYLDLNPQDPKSLPIFSSDSHDWVRDMEDSETYAQIDVQLDLEQRFFSAVKTGIKWRNQTIENNRRIGSIDTEHPLWEDLSHTGLASVSAGLTPQLHQHTASAKSLTRFAWVDEQLANTIIAPVLQQGLMTYRYDRDAFYQIDENITAAYAKGEFEFDRWRGNLGLRAVHTAQISSAFSEQALLANRRGYNDYLPSLNLTYELRPDLLLRSSISRAMARPSFQNLSGNIVIDGTNGNASGGNPKLEPFRAQQGDLGIEWYFDNASLLSATAFYKTISTFIYSQTQEEIVNNKRLNVTRPYNAEGAHISGLELQWQKNLGGGFGLLSNYTYTKATVASADKQQLLKLPGNSRDQINASLYYEDKTYSLRLSYNYRSKSYGELLSGTQDETNAYQQWDFTTAWQASEHTSIYLEGINLTNEVIYYRTANDIPQGLYENGRRFSLGVRLRF